MEDGASAHAHAQFSVLHAWMDAELWPTYALASRGPLQQAAISYLHTYIIHPTQYMYMHRAWTLST
jgi:hypothetical protein